MRVFFEFNSATQLSFDKRKWIIEDNKGKRHEHDPETTQLNMFNCFLYNNKAEAEKMAGSKGKKFSLVAWIECERVIADSEFIEDPLSIEVQYNPIKAPHWVEEGENVDDKQYPMLVSNGFKIFYNKE